MSESQPKSETRKALCQTGHLSCHRASHQARSAVCEGVVTIHHRWLPLNGRLRRLCAAHSASLSWGGGGGGGGGGGYKMKYVCQSVRISFSFGTGCIVSPCWKSNCVQCAHFSFSVSSALGSRCLSVCVCVCVRVCVCVCVCV